MGATLSCRGVLRGWGKARGEPADTKAVFERWTAEAKQLCRKNKKALIAQTEASKDESPRSIDEDVIRVLKRKSIKAYEWAKNEQDAPIWELPLKLNATGEEVLDYSTLQALETKDSSVSCPVAWYCLFVEERKDPATNMKLICWTHRSILL